MTVPAADVKSLFGKALELATPADRAAFLDEACAANPALRSEVEVLLQALEKAGNFMVQAVPPPRTAAFAPLAERPGTVIGPYKLLEQIGEGGMGTVFLAEQTEPVRRQVALKIIKPGMNSAQVIARFEVERQALALMDHPNIAKVLDAGVTGHSEPDAPVLKLRAALDCSGLACFACMHTLFQGARRAQELFQLLRRPWTRNSCGRQRWAKSCG